MVQLRGAIPIVKKPANKVLQLTVRPVTAAGSSCHDDLYSPWELPLFAQSAIWLAPALIRSFQSGL